MVRALVVLVAVLLVGHAAHAQLGPLDGFKALVRAATWVVGPGRCTALAMDTKHIVTASHCVPARGASVLVYRAQDMTPLEVKVIFDNFGEDIAFLDSEVPLPGPLRFPTCPIQPKDQELWAYTVSLGLVGWEAVLKYQGRFLEIGDGGSRWVVVYHGNAYPGASGSIVWNVDRGCAVSSITHGSVHGFPVAIFGTSSELILDAYTRMLAGAEK